jgi:hypothetical protein
MIRLISNIESLQDIRDFWIEVYNADPSATPFQSFDYIYASVIFENATNKNSLYIIGIKDDPTNKWIAFFPFSKCRSGELRFLNFRNTDFCGPIIIPEFNHYNLYEELSQFILNEKQIKGVTLDNLLPSSQLMAVFAPHFKYNIITGCNYYSEIEIYNLPKDKDAIDGFRYLRSNRKKNLRRIKERYSDCQYKYVSQLTGDAYPQKEVDILVDVMLKDGIRSRGYFSSTMLQFWEELYNKGILSAALLYKEGKIVSCNFVIEDHKHNQYIKWIMLYADNKFNMAINMFIEDELYKSGGATINFARGIYDYKLVNFHPDVKPLFRLYLSKTKKRYFKYFSIMSFHFLLRLLNAGKFLRGISKKCRMFKR